MSLDLVFRHILLYIYQKLTNKKMKFQFKNIAIAIAATLALTSCSNDDDNSSNTNELTGLTKFQEITNDTHTIELYSSKIGGLEQGYNDITVRLKNNASNQYITNASISWTPKMHMMSMTHSCPNSSIIKNSNTETTYSGYIVFQMPENDTEYWDLTFNYIIDGISYLATDVISVPASEKRTINTFTGTDGIKYIVAFVNPTEPKVAVNDFTAGVWKMENMMSFPVVDNYTLKIDPRMPSMGNHSSPNNLDAIQTTSGGLYNGKLSLTMTGYWKINLQLLNENNEVLKGEEITETVESSSIYFEIEF